MPICQICQISFVHKPKTTGRFCSRSCYDFQRRSTAKGSRKLDRDGYVLVTGKRGQWVREHRRVMEAFIGRPLLGSEVVDHINGVRHDNRPENLRVTTWSEHAKGHLAEQWGSNQRPKPQRKPRLGANYDREKKGFASVPIGAKCMHGSGYIQVKTPDGWKLEHRVLMEQLLGRKLSRREVVDHIDRNRANNEPANLRLFESQGKHVTETGILDALISAVKRRRASPTDSSA